MNPPTRLPAAAPRRVRDRLAQAADGPVRVLHRGPHALYLDIDGSCLGVVDTHAVQVPCALRTASLAGIHGATARVSGGMLVLDGVPVRIGRLVDVSVARLPFRPGPVGVEPGARESWVAQLIGSGSGLTPYGDDVLCGWLAVHRALGVPTPATDATVRSMLHRTTLLSAALLDCAMHGEVVPQFAAWVSAVGTPAEPAAAAALTAIGHTSGRGLLAGARRGLADLTAAVAA